VLPENFANYEDFFRCPICSSAMKVVDARSLICPNDHCFDISRKGYVNFLTHSPQTKYGKKLFESRKRISDNGCFEPLTARLCDSMIGELKPTRPIAILDAGCGEGSHLTDIQHKFMKQAECDLLAVGIDIAKAGIHMAARGASQAIWCVADLARCPLADERFDCILNLLSPSNYSEFHRMLADDGMVIKVIPDSKYLQELRGIFYKQTDRTAYSNEPTVELFKRHFELVDIQRVQYGVTMDHKGMEQLVHMTPLSWGVSEERIQQVLGRHRLEVTFDFAVLLGKKRAARRAN